MSEQTKPASRQLEILDILKRFNFHPKVANSVLDSYCKRMGYEFLSEGAYQDHRYQYFHDQRAMVIIPLILQIIQKYQYIPDYVGETKKSEIKEQNEQLEVEIAEMCAANGIEYREIDVLIKNFASTIGATIEAAGTRMNNMCATAIATIAGDKFGDNLPVASLAAYYEEVARR
ncbi:hypothetical protein A2Z56_02430 [Candidatus Kaiserbacteria bacterium RIFCSPHIGHO2_12_45_16]|nr:MAG: hypothetical protein A2Z56_02430 [Candidatus Kaiserbacteria bacterium RIFCSPHIGHO2_12_45_16]